MRDRLSALPTDIFVMITAELPPGDLYNLALTSSWNHERTLPELYRTIRMKWHPEVHPPVLLILRTVMDNPDLAGLVRRVYVTGSSRTSANSPKTVWPEWMRMDQTKIEALREFVRSSRLPSQNLWIAGLDFGSIEVLIALLLSTLTRLECFCVDFDFNSEFIALIVEHAVIKMVQERNAGVVRSSSSNGQLFSVLKHVCFTDPEGIYYWFHKSPEAEQLTFLFYLPEIKSIQMCIPNFGPQGIRWPFAPPPVASKLTFLNLRDREVKPEVLMELLRRTPNLQHMKYEMWIVDDACVVYDDVKYDCDVEVLYRALYQTRHSLKKLSIKIFYEPEYHELLRRSQDQGMRLNHFSKPNAFGSLSDFEQLESLTIPWAFLLGTTYKPISVETLLETGLPSSITYLELREDYIDMQEVSEWTVDACLGRLSHFLNHWSLFAPQLSDFRLEIYDGAIKGWQFTDTEFLRSTCERMGLRTYDVRISHFREDEPVNYYDMYWVW